MTEAGDALGALEVVVSLALAVAALSLVPSVWLLSAALFDAQPARQNNNNARAG